MYITCSIYIHVHVPFPVTLPSSSLPPSFNHLNLSPSLLSSIPPPLPPSLPTSLPPSPPLPLPPSLPPFSRQCQTKDWPEHRLKCKGGQPSPVGLPFVISLPAKQLTLAKLREYAEKFARLGWVWVCGCMCTHHVHACVRACTCTCMCACVCVHVCACSCTYNSVNETR